MPRERSCPMGSDASRRSCCLEEGRALGDLKSLGDRVVCCLEHRVAPGDLMCLEQGDLMSLEHRALGDLMSLGDRVV